jgi:hypothetical protein
MNVFRLYQCLTEHEKRELKNLIEKHYAVVSTDMTVKDWINAVNPSIRLINCLRKNFPDKRISEISSKDLIKIRGVGVRTYREFQKLIGDI